MCIQLILYATMADAPPWTNLVFQYDILICPIVIWTLLLIFPPAFANLLKCHHRSGGTLLHQHRRSLTPQHHHPSRKKREFRQPPPLQHLLHRPKCCGSPCLQLLGLSTSWDVTLNHLSSEQSVQHVGANQALSPDTVFEQRHSKACSKLATSHWYVLILTHI